MKAPAIILLSIVLTAEALPSALIQSPIDGDKPIDTIGEGLNNPKVAEDVIALAFIEKVAEAAVLEVMGSMAHAQVQERGGDDVAAHAAAKARRERGRSIETEIAQVQERRGDDVAAHAAAKARYEGNQGRSIEAEIAQVQERGKGDASNAAPCYTLACFFARQGRSIESEDRNSNASENRIFGWIGDTVQSALNKLDCAINTWKKC